jgi:hypothetical protein
MLEGARGTRQYIHAEDKKQKNTGERIHEVLHMWGEGRIWGGP